MPVPNGKIETNNHKKQRRWSLIGILSKKKKLKKSQESVDFGPYDGKMNQKLAQNNHLERSDVYPIQQYTCSPRQIRRCNSLQYTCKPSACSNIISQPTSNEWKSSQQSVSSSSSSACYSDIGVYRNSGFSSNRSSYFEEVFKEENEQSSPVLEHLPFRSSSEIGDYHNKTSYLQKYRAPPVVERKRIIGKKIPPPPPPRDPNVKAVYYFRNNRLMSRESDSTYFSQGSDDNIPEKIHEHEVKHKDHYCVNEPPRSRRPIRICDVETLSTESEHSETRTQSVEEALQELEDIYNSLGLSDEDLLDRAERRDLPTLHQNMHYESSDELDSVTVNRLLPKTRRSGVPDIVSDDMAYRRLNKKEPKRSSFVAGSFLLVLPTVYNLDKPAVKPSGEPDVTLDDVVFRSRRQHLNLLKVPEPQPPFGIPLGPIIGTAASDYLHAVPVGRYKPSFHPRKMPDTVEDDLAYRTLRKDHKRKTCVDFSFVHRTGLNTDYRLIPGPDRDSGMKNDDTHWITRKTGAGERANDKICRVKLLLDGRTGDGGGGGQNVMVVKINHHKPIMLSGFTLNEANQLSESFFCTKLPQHEHRQRHGSNNIRPRLTNRTCSAPVPNGGRAESSEVEMLVMRHRRRRSKSHHRHASDGPPQLEAPVIRESASDPSDAPPDVQLTDLPSARRGKSQPNFRELILREYGHMTCPPSSITATDRQSEEEEAEADSVVRTTDYRSRAPPPERRHRASDVMPIACAAGRPATEDRRRNGGSAIAAVDLSAGPVTLTAGTTRNSSSSSSTVVVVVDRAETTATERSATSDPTDPSSSPSAECPNRVPGCLEVCLYITIYVYHFFSSNAYSTFVALIFLVALHLCRRLS